MQTCIWCGLSARLRTANRLHKWTAEWSGGCQACFQAETCRGP